MYGQRRFLHVHTSSKYKGNKEYFKKFYSYIVNNRRSLYSIYMYLLRIKLPSRLDVDEYASSLGLIVNKNYIIIERSKELKGVKFLLSSKKSVNMSPKWGALAAAHGDSRRESGASRLLDHLCTPIIIFFCQNSVTYIIEWQRFPFFLLPIFNCRY